MKAAVQAVIDVGYDIERVEVDKNGTVSVLTRNPILNSSERIAPPVATGTRCSQMPSVRLKYVNKWTDAKGRTHIYFRRPGHKAIRLPFPSDRPSSCSPTTRR